MLNLEMINQEQSLSDREQPWYHTSAFLFVASWKISNEVIQKLEYSHFLFHWMWHCFGKTALKDIVSPRTFKSLLKIDFLPELCICEVVSQPVNAWQKSRCSKYSFSVELIISWMLQLSLFRLSCFESTYSLCKSCFCG